jgi:hypothetical protein
MQDDSDLDNWLKLANGDDDDNRNLAIALWTALPIAERIADWLPRLMGFYYNRFLGFTRQTAGIQILELIASAAKMQGIDLQPLDSDILSKDIEARTDIYFATLSAYLATQTQSVRDLYKWADLPASFLMYYAFLRWHEQDPIFRRISLADWRDILQRHNFLKPNHSYQASFPIISQLKKGLPTPDFICDFTELIAVSLDNLTQITNKIYQLKQLKSLSFHDCQFAGQPQLDLAAFGQLKKIFLSRSLDILVSSGGEQIELIHWRNIDTNHLSLPSMLAQMPNLKDLNLEGAYTYDSELPIFFQLEWLIIRHTNGAFIAHDNFLAFRRTLGVIISKCQDTIDLRQFRHFSKMQTLSIEANAIVEFPFFLAQLPHLTRLTINTKLPFTADIDEDFLRIILQHFKEFGLKTTAKNKATIRRIAAEIDSDCKIDITIG